MNNKMKKILLILASAAVMFSGCVESPAQVEVDNSSVELSQDAFHVGPDGGNVSLTVTSSEDWRVVGNCDWARPTSEGGKSGATLTFDIDEMAEEATHSVEFKVFAGSAVKVVTLVQDPEYGFELLSEESVTFTSFGGLLQVFTSTNMPELAVETDQEWLKFSRRYSSFGKEIFEFTVEESEVYKDRGARISITGANVNTNVNVTQEQKDVIMIDDPAVVHTGLSAASVTFTIKSNVDFEYSLPDWLTEDSRVAGATDSEGLVPTTITLSFGDALYTRLASLYLSAEDAELTMTVKQANPNPIYAYINDNGLRTYLSNQSWIVADPTEDEPGRCEVVGNGMTATSLSLSRQNSIAEISGLGAFPALASITLSNSTAFTVLDLRDCKGIASLSITGSNLAVRHIHLGSNPVTSVKFGSGSQYGPQDGNLTVTGENLEVFNMNTRTSSIQWNWEYKWVDFSGCPNLKELHVNRYYNDICLVEHVYLTSAQIDAYNAGTLTIEKQDYTSITDVADKK